MHQIEPIPFAEVEIDSIKYFDMNIEKYNLCAIEVTQNLKESIHYPPIARRAGLEGSVQVRAYINLNPA